MKCFLFKIILFIIFVLAVTTFIYVSKLSEQSYYRGNENFSQKLEKFRKNKGKINTVFFGSSRINSHINPVTFDSLLASSNVFSFNFGVPGGVSPEQYFLYENFITSKDVKGIKYAFLELTPLIIRQQKFLFAERVYYWQNFSYFKFIVSTVIQEKYPLKTKIYRIYTFAASLFYKVFSLNDFKKNIIKKHNNKPITTVSNTGFFPLVSVSPITESMSKALNKIKEREVAFDLNPSELYLNYSHLSKIKSLIDLSKEKHIQLYFIISPRVDRTEIYGLKEVYDAYVLDLSNTTKYGIFYEPQFSYDEGHLNAEGAAFYTNYLALAFLSKLGDSR